eukprot:9879571-Ditylum_brightwellii.AAC.1
MGRTGGADVIRSPVTNAILTNPKAIMPNLAVQGMAIRHCEDRGYELLKRVEYAIQHNHGMCAD